MLWLIVVVLVIFFVWFVFVNFDEVVVGEVKVMLVLKGQVIQSFEGGILLELVVCEGDVVDVGQWFVMFDLVFVCLLMEEMLEWIIVLQGCVVWLYVEMNDLFGIEFLVELVNEKVVIGCECQLFVVNWCVFCENVVNLCEQLWFVEDEFWIVLLLLKIGVINEVEVFWLCQKVVEFLMKFVVVQSEYYVVLKVDYLKMMVDFELLFKVCEGCVD